MSDQVHAARRWPLAAVLRALRPSHWAKNLLVLAPAFLAHRWTDQLAVAGSVVAFCALCAVASAGYIVNDLRDVAADRAHPSKRNRPFASGALSARTGVCLAFALSIVGALVAGLFSLPLGLFVVAYMVGTTAYSSGLKREVVLDVVALAGLYVLRLQVGAVASSAPISPWFLAFSGLFFLSLALAKRHVELRRQQHRAQTPGRGYRPDDWPFTLAAGMASAMASVVVFLLYVAMNAGPPGAYKANGALWGIGAILAIWQCRLWLQAHRGDLQYDPVEYAFRDRASLCLGLASLGLYLVAL
jgi:4-hydroxybenzoate polyprenyltransferase